MTVEEYFVKEFKEYSAYKAHILGGSNYVDDAHVANVMNSMPTNEAMSRDYGMKMQYNYLRGLDLGCRPAENGLVSFSEFLRKALPNTMPALQEKEAINYCLIRGVNAPFFDKLNRTTAVLQARLSFKKRLTGNDGHFLQTADSQVMTRDIDIPQGSRVILSSTSIHLRNFVVDEHGRRVSSDVPHGFGYIDFVDTDEGRKFLYYVPRANIYPLNLNVMLLTRTRLTARYYWGREYLFNRGIERAFLYVTPYSSSVLKPENVAFCLKASISYEQEIQTLENYWQATMNRNGTAHPSILYPFEALQVDGMYASKTSDGNLGIRTLPQPDREPYQAITTSLAERGDTDMQIVDGAV